MPNSTPQSMDKAASDAGIELEEIREKHPEATKELESWMKKWVPLAGYKRLGKILADKTL